MNWLKNGGITSPRGFLASALCAGLKVGNQKDLVLIMSASAANTAGLITRNRVKAVPCQITAAHLAKGGTARAILVNSGNANCGTGEQGLKETKALLKKLAPQLGVAVPEILVASTGIIGVPLPVEKISKALPNLIKGLSETGGHDAAVAIMTTDTFAKEAATSFVLHEREIRIGAMAKGAGMIHPNLATMLVFLTTDLAISQPLLKEALQTAVNLSFHHLTIDGDTSTNDMVLMLANGAALNDPITEKNRDYHYFLSCLCEVCQKLAKEIVRDAEGATKFITIEVYNAKDETAASTIAQKIAVSSLVKTALFGEDPNWGRILMAIGNSGVDFSPENLTIAFGPHLVFQNGTVVRPFPEAAVREVLKAKEVTIRVSLGTGRAAGWYWTSDLTYDYVKINASYST